ncbi:hypothetical protein D9M70_586280 [compost metagenome]
MLVGAFLGDVASPLADCRHQFDLVVEIDGLRRVRQLQGLAGGYRHHRVSRLAEEERRLAVRIEPHLAGMGGVVAAYAVDAADGETRVAAGDGQAGGRLRREYEGHGSGSSVQTVSRASRSSPRASWLGRSE